MSFHLIAAAPDAALLTDRPVIGRKERAVVETAVDLLVQAQARLAEVEAHRAAEGEAGRADGYAAGYEAGLTAAARDVAERAARLHREMEAERERLRETAGRLALDVVRRIAAELAPEAVLAALAERAVKDVLPEAPVVVHVAPDGVGAVSTRLWPIGAAIEVRPDDALAPGDCVIETAAGRSHAGLEVQLSALERAFERGRAA